MLRRKNIVLSKYDGFDYYVHIRSTRRATGITDIDIYGERLELRKQADADAAHDGHGMQEGRLTADGLTSMAHERDVGKMGSTVRCSRSRGTALVSHQGGCTTCLTQRAGQ